MMSMVVRVVVCLVLVVSLWCCGVGWIVECDVCVGSAVVVGGCYRGNVVIGALSVDVVDGVTVDYVAVGVFDCIVGVVGVVSADVVDNMVGCPAFVVCVVTCVAGSYVRVIIVYCVAVCVWCVRVCVCICVRQLVCCRC